jgi:hypothetical protein
MEAVETAEITRLGSASKTSGQICLKIFKIFLPTMIKLLILHETFENLT